jgi:hypothetical protein
MMEKILRSRLDRVIRRRRWEILCWRLAACWSVAAMVGAGCLLLQTQFGWALPAAGPMLAGAALAAAIVLIWQTASIPPDYRAIARKIERRHPALKGLLLTAAQPAPPDRVTAGYLQHRVNQQAIEHSREHDWRGVVPLPRMQAAAGLQLAALALFFLMLVTLRNLERSIGTTGGPLRGIAVAPGDTSLERGESLVVLARFGGALPAGVTLVVRRSGAAPQAIALVKSLADPVFGVSLPEVDRDLIYHLDYGVQHTRDYQVTVFERPRLERADADLTYPAYTRFPPRRIENTRRVSAVEGTRLNYSLQLNKPVAVATLIAHDAKKTEITLQVAAGRAVATLPAYTLLASQTYDLRLVDRQGRTNPLPTPFVIDVLPNRPPEFSLSSPRGDLRPSPIEEINFAGTLRSDFGVNAYGLSYTLAGGETKVVELGRDVGAMEKRPFATVLRLEDLGVQPDQLLSWYVWADDTGPDGHPRRTNGDLFFAEIRSFDEIFRESQAMPSGDDPAGNPSDQNNPNQRLAELQKQIISATWKLQRAPQAPKYADDAKVVGDGQDQALSQAGTARDKAEDPRARALWTAVTEEMTQAAGKLHEAAKTPDALSPALTAEQRAYAALLRLQSRETRVSRGRSGGGGGRGEAGQRQLDQLDLTQEQNRYETQRQATPVESPERREQLQVMNRLQELARRQEEVNDRLKEMQTALQEAGTAQSRADIQRQLKRLQEEQQQVLADADELRQRMDQQTNQSNLNDQRRQLEQTRDQVQQAGQLAAQGRTAEALAAGTRAQREFQEMHDQLRQQNSNQFSDDLREMRNEARELAEREAAIAAKLAPNAPGAPRRRLSEAAEDSSPAGELDAQKKRVAALIDRAKQVSQQAESTEPLLAEKLYDSLRKVTQDDAGTVKEFQQDLLNQGLLTRSLNDRMTDPAVPDGTKSLDLTSALLQEGYGPQAAAAEQRARAGIDDLKTGVEQAAQSVIGDDTAALRLAQSELDAVTSDLKREAAAGAGSNPPPGAAAGGTPGEKPAAGAQASALPPAAGSGQRPAGGPAGAGGGGDPLGLNNLVNGGGSRGAAPTDSPITGNGYGQWSDRLRDVEEIVDTPDLRNAVAGARERARLLRQDFARDQKRPDWAVVEQQVVQPLQEVRNQISDELARRGSKDSLVPIDRDPVPHRYAESVRRYYEELGKDK